MLVPTRSAAIQEYRGAATLAALFASTCAAAASTLAGAGAAARVFP